MSEIVRINASGVVGIVRATYLNKDTGEELVEVQIVGRETGPRSFVKRAYVTTVDRRALSLAVAGAVLLTLSEVNKSVSNEFTGGVVREALDVCVDEMKDLVDAIGGVMVDTGGNVV